MGLAGAKHIYFPMEKMLSLLTKCLALVWMTSGEMDNLSCGACRHGAHFADNES